MKKKDFRIYKPYAKDGKFLGSASIIEVKVVIDENAQAWNKRRVFAFWVSSPQTGEDDNGNSTFAWKDKEKTINFKIEPVDAGEILAVLKGKKLSAGQSGGKFEGLFHQSDAGNSSLTFKLVPDKGYYFRLSAKRKDTGNVAEVKHSISFAEGMILEVLLEEYIRLYYDWK